MRIKKAFSIIELIAVVAILTLLVAIAIPQVHAVRRRALDAASTANMRTHAQVVQTYSSDYRGVAPFLADPEATFTVARGGGLTITYEFFECVELWGVPLVDQYYGFGLGSHQWDANIEWSIFSRPGPGGLLYQYSPTFFSQAPYWNERTRDLRYLKPVRLSAVRYPASKAVFLELDENRGFPVWLREGFRSNPGWAFAFGDGSVRRPESGLLVEPFPLGEGNALGGRFTYGVIGLHTQDGILGRDVE